MEKQAREKCCMSSHRNSVLGLVCGFEKGSTSSLVQLQK